MSTIAGKVAVLTEGAAPMTALWRPSTHFVALRFATTRFVAMRHPFRRKREPLLSQCSTRFVAMRLVVT
jgi:hypothetical protein